MSAIINEAGKSKEEIEALEIAEDARETEWKQPSLVADLFMGKIQTDALFPFPEQSPEDRKIGDDFLAKIKSVLDQHIDADEVDRKCEVPQTGIDALNAIGAFGLKIPKEYGGLGLSQVNYCRVLALCSAHCVSTAVLLSAHQSIGVPVPLKMFGTDAQKKKYLPRLAKGEISAFALTEPEVGSDPAKMTTTATLSEDGSHYVLNGLKLWCTNGVIADIMVVMAQTKPIMKNGREKKQISAFIFETKNAEGFKVVHRCRFMGLNGVQNGLLEFKNVKIPKENLLLGEGKGLKLALVTLNQGRLSLPASAVGWTRKCIEWSREWGLERVQWGAPIGKHEPGGSKIAHMTSHLFAIDAVTTLACLWVDQSKRDIRLEAAMCKLFGSVETHKIAELTLQLRGGRGYETEASLKDRGEKGIPIERIVRDSRINQIIEGTTEVMGLFISREALDKHLSVAGDLIDPKSSLKKKLIALIRSIGFYGLWYPKMWLSCTPWPMHASLGVLGKHMRFVKQNSRKLARTTFHLMVLNGPKLERKQNQLMRLVLIATDLFAMCATIGKAHGLKKRGEPYQDVDNIADSFCKDARLRIRNEFQAICCNNDRGHRKLSKAVLDGKNLWIEREF